MDSATSDRSHLDRTLRVLEHVEPIVVLLASTESLTAHDDADVLARSSVIRQWRDLAEAVTHRAPVIDDIVGPAVSEFVLLRYLSMLPRHDANAFVAARRQAELADAADAAAGPVPERPTVEHRSTLEVLADLGYRNGWALERTDRLGRHALPSTRWMASAVGELHMYDHLLAARALRVAAARPSSANASRSERASGTAFQLAWGSIVVCRTLTAARPLVRGVDLPSPHRLVALMAECAAAVPPMVALVTNLPERGPSSRRSRRETPVTDRPLAS